jgi:hypothetical protein
MQIAPAFPPSGIRNIEKLKVESVKPKLKTENLPPHRLGLLISHSFAEVVNNFEF